MGQLIVDFCALRARLVVEVDGPVHVEQRLADEHRDALLQAKDFRVLRVTNERVLHHLPGVLEEIRKAVAGRLC